MAELLLTRGRRSFDVRYLPGFTPLAAFCLVALYLPLILVIFFSFNAERSITVFSHFGLNWYEEAAQNTFVQNATWLSLKLAFFATLVATTCATMAGLATTRRKPFPGQSVVYGVINQPLMIPEIVTAVALLAFFGAIKQATNVYGFGYLLLAHIVFCIPFAYMPIRAPFAGHGPDDGTSGCRPLCLTLEGFQACYIANDDPWNHCRRDAVLRDIV